MMDANEWTTGQKVAAGVGAAAAIAGLAWIAFGGSGKVDGAMASFETDPYRAGLASGAIGPTLDYWGDPRSPETSPRASYEDWREAMESTATRADPYVESAGDYEAYRRGYLEARRRVDAHPKNVVPAFEPFDEGLGEQSGFDPLRDLRWHEVPDEDEGGWYWNEDVVPHRTARHDMRALVNFFAVHGGRVPTFELHYSGLGKRMAPLLERPPLRDYVRRSDDGRFIELNDAGKALARRAGVSWAQ